LVSNTPLQALIRCVTAAPVSDSLFCAGFDPVKLSVAVSEFMLHLARHPAFVRAIAEEPDYNEAILKVRFTCFMNHTTLDNVDIERLQQKTGGKPGSVSSAIDKHC
jgi:hypothetical protein